MSATQLCLIVAVVIFAAEAVIHRNFVAGGLAFLTAAFLLGA